MLKKQVLFALSTMLATVQCLAADDSPQPNGQNTQADSSQLAEIVVTAQKRSESILSTAVAVSAVDSEMLRQIAPRTASDIAMVAPALQVTTPSGASFPIFSLRGVTQNDYSSMASGPIATYVDEVYRSGPVFFSKQIYDLDRIEVLRGPQGTLYGKNATGGAINFVSTKPGFDTNGYVDLTAGNYGEYDTAGAFQTGLTDTLAMRVAFATSHTDGWQKNINPGGQDLGGNRDYGVRLSLLYRPTDSLEMILRLATSHVGPSSWALETPAYSTGIGGGLYTQFHNLYPASNPRTDYFPTFDWLHTATTGAEERQDGASHDISLTTTWHALSRLDVVSITAFSRGYWNFLEPNASNAPVAPIGDYEDASGDQFSEDFRVVSHLDGSTNYLAGLYLSRDRLISQFQEAYYTDIDFNGDGQLNSQDCLANLSPTQLLYPYGCIQRNQYRQERRSIAVYGDGTTHLTGALALQYGLRLTRDTLRVSEYTAAVYGTDGTPLFNTIPGDPNNLSAVLAPISRTYTKTTGRLGLEYTLPDKTLLYGTFSRGYRGGASNAAAFNAPSEVTVVPPEVLDSVVVGWKGEYLDRRLQLMAEAFFYRYKGEQALNVDPVTFLQTEVSIARSTIKGGEIEVTAKPWSALTVRVNGSYMHSRIDEGELSGVDLKGNELPLAPTYTVNGNVTWDVLKLPAGKLSVFAAERYVARQHWDLFQDPADELNPYAITDARLNFDFARLPIRISVYGKNLMNKLYYLEKANIASFGFVYDHVGDPRTYGAEFRYTF
jgi:iron complex outermembrane recepter protein